MNRIFTVLGGGYSGVERGWHYFNIQEGKWPRMGARNRSQMSDYSMKIFAKLYFYHGARAFFFFPSLWINLSIKNQFKILENIFYSSQWYAAIMQREELLYIFNINWCADGLSLKIYIREVRYLIRFHLFFVGHVLPAENVNIKCVLAMSAWVMSPSWDMAAFYIYFSCTSLYLGQN